MLKPKVLITQRDYRVTTMFREHGWSITSLIEEADLIQFTGGADVSPSMYGEEKHSTSHCHKERDILEKAIYNKGLALNKSFAGICRGGQLLNVLNGGKLYQDVDMHRHSHTIVCHTEDPTNRKAIEATSTHHQMMRPADGAKVLAIAFESTRRTSMEDKSVVVGIRQQSQPDYEVLFYPKTKSLCFQPHPEYIQCGKELTDYYFNLLKEELDLCAES